MSTVGLVGLAVMGQNLALNVAEKGFPISVYNRSGDKTDACVSRAAKEGEGLTEKKFDREVTFRGRVERLVNLRIAVFSIHRARGDHNSCSRTLNKCNTSSIAQTSARFCYSFFRQTLNRTEMQSRANSLFALTNFSLFHSFSTHYQPGLTNLKGFKDLKEFVQSLEKPR